MASSLTRDLTPEESAKYDHLRTAKGKLKRPDPNFKYLKPGSFRWLVRRRGLSVAIRTKLAFPVWGRTGNLINDLIYKYYVLPKLVKRDEQLIKEDLSAVRFLNPLTGKKQDRIWDWNDIQHDRKSTFVDVMSPKKPPLKTGFDSKAGPWGA